MMDKAERVPLPKIHRVLDHREVVRASISLGVHRCRKRCALLVTYELLESLPETNTQEETHGNRQALTESCSEGSSSRAHAPAQGTTLTF